MASTTPVWPAPAAENLFPLPAALPASIACWIDAAWILVDHLESVVRRVSCVLQSFHDRQSTANRRARCLTEKDVRINHPQ